MNFLPSPLGAAEDGEAFAGSFQDSLIFFLSPINVGAFELTGWKSNVVTIIGQN